jgi:hypothetical protein
MGNELLYDFTPTYDFRDCAIWVLITTEPYNVKSVSVILYRQICSAYCLTLIHHQPINPTAGAQAILMDNT